MSSEATTLAARGPAGLRTIRRLRRSISWCAPWRRLADVLIRNAQNDFPGYLARHQELVCRPGLLDEERGRDYRPHLAVGDHRPDVGDNLGDDLALAAGAADGT